MRTDAKIGFAIGGVLLAVLAAYLIVVPPKAKSKHDAAKPTVAVVAPADVIPETPAAAVASATPSSPTPAAPTQVANNTSIPPMITATNAGPVTDTPNTVVENNQKPTSPEALDNPLLDGTFHTGKPGKNTDTGDVIADARNSTVDPNATSVTTDSKTASTGHKGRVGRHHTGETITAENTTVHTTEHATEHATASGTRQYTVKSGQTLSSIASDVYGNARFWVAIQRDNPGLDAKHLKVGQKINMPDISDVRPSGPVLVDVLQPATTGGGTEIEPASAKTYRVVAGDSLYKIAKKVFGSGRRADEIYALNKDLIGDDEARLKLGMVLKLPEGATHTAVTIAQ
jgi:nucleoid-associated protein YgaU